jgi:hypothetical protein
MFKKRTRRRFDLFAVLVVVLAIGMTLTLAYQVSLYYGDLRLPMAKESPSRGTVGG